MTKKQIVNESLLNEILLAFAYSKTTCGGMSTELVDFLADAFGKTSLIIEEHMNILERDYKECEWSKIKKLVPHKKINE